MQHADEACCRFLLSGSSLGISPHMRLLPLGGEIPWLEGQRPALRWVSVRDGEPGCHRNLRAMCCLGLAKLLEDTRVCSKYFRPETLRVILKGCSRPVITCLHIYIKIKLGCYTFTQSHVLCVEVMKVKIAHFQPLYTRFRTSWIVHHLSQGDRALLQGWVGIRNRSIRRSQGQDAQVPAGSSRHLGL